MCKLKSLLMISLTVGLLATQASAALNIYCDPIDTVYAGGTPLFDESTNTTLSIEEYLAKKGLNRYCDPIDTVYMGGTPLLNERTGKTMTLEQYLAKKKLKPHQ